MVYKNLVNYLNTFLKEKSIKELFFPNKIVYFIKISLNNKTKN